MGIEGFSYSDPEFIQRVRIMAAEGASSRSAYEQLKREGVLPKTARLDTFRSTMSKHGVSWGLPTANIDPMFAPGVVSFMLPMNELTALTLQAERMGLTRNILAQRLIRAITTDNLYKAVLDEEYDLIGSNYPQKP